MKYCPQCQATFDDSVSYCPNCGVPTVPVQEPEQPYVPVQETAAAAPEDAKKAMIFGIVGLALSSFAHLVGLVFSILGLNTAKKIQQECGVLTGKAKIGKILATVGLILNIVGMVGTFFLILYYIFVFGLVIAGGASRSFDFSKIFEDVFDLIVRFRIF